VSLQRREFLRRLVVAGAAGMVGSCTGGRGRPPVQEPARGANIALCRRAPAPTGSDDTAMLQRFLDSVPDGGCAILHPAATYRVVGGLALTERRDYEIRGEGATLLADRPGHIDRSAKGGGFSHRKQLRIDGGSNILVEGLVITGPNPERRYVPEYEFEHGIQIGGVTEALVLDCTVANTFGSGITVSDRPTYVGSGVQIPSHAVVVRGCTFDTIGTQALVINGSVDDVTFDRNRISHVARSGIDIEPVRDRVLTNIRVTANTLSDFGLGWLAGGGEFTDHVYAGRNRIVGDTLWMKAGHFGTNRRRNWTIEGNVSDTPARLGGAALFQFHKTDLVRIDGNVQPFDPNATGFAIAPHEGCGFRARGNDFSGATALYVGSPCDWVDGGNTL
jgi:hypothetical protein